MSDPVGPPVDAGLLERFRRAGPRIAWSALPSAKPSRSRRTAKAPTARLAKLDDETARIETRAAGLYAESCPVGALVLLLEWDRQRTEPVLTTLDAGVDPAFPNGAIVARWTASTGTRSTLGAKDLVDLARFALR